MSAIISPCGLYRYRLDRDIEGSLFAGNAGRVVWVMLNPSVADATHNDPTMVRVIDFSRAAGFTTLTVVNLFALRSTDPAALCSHPDPVGPDCDRHIAEVLEHADAVVCAWGAGVPRRHARRKHEVLAMVLAAGLEPLVLGKTSAGQPRHPLMMPKSATFTTWV